MRRERRDPPVVGGGKDGDAAAAMRHLVALGLDLVAADDVVQVVLLQEGLGDIGAKLAADTPLADRASILGGRGDGELRGPTAPPPATPPLPAVHTCRPGLGNTDLRLRI